MIREILKTDEPPPSKLANGFSFEITNPAD
jgi:hypothetical protein